MIDIHNMKTFVGDYINIFIETRNIHDIDIHGVREEKLKAFFNIYPFPTDRILLEKFRSCLELSDYFNHGAFDNLTQSIEEGHAIIAILDDILTRRLPRSTDYDNERWLYIYSLYEYLLPFTAATTEPFFEKTISIPSFFDDNVLCCQNNNLDLYFKTEFAHIISDKHKGSLFSIISNVISMSNTPNTYAKESVFHYIETLELKLRMYHQLGLRKGYARCLHVLNETFTAFKETKVLESHRKDHLEVLHKFESSIFYYKQLASSISSDPWSSFFESLTRYLRVNKKTLQQPSCIDAVIENAEKLLAEPCHAMPPSFLPSAPALEKYTNMISTISTCLQRERFQSDRAPQTYESIRKQHKLAGLLHSGLLYNLFQIRPKFDGKTSLTPIVLTTLCLSAYIKFRLNNRLQNTSALSVESTQKLETQNQIMPKSTAPAQQILESEAKSKSKSKKKKSKAQLRESFEAQKKQLFENNQTELEHLTLTQANEIKLLSEKLEGLSLASKEPSHLFIFPRRIKQRQKQLRRARYCAYRSKLTYHALNSKLEILRNNQEIHLQNTRNTLKEKNSNEINGKQSISNKQLEFYQTELSSALITFEKQSAETIRVTEQELIEKVQSLKSELEQTKPHIVLTPILLKPFTTIPLPDFLLPLLYNLHSLFIEHYIFGGYVRDQLLGIDAGKIDIDIMVNIEPEIFKGLINKLYPNVTHSVRNQRRLIVLSLSETIKIDFWCESWCNIRDVLTNRDLSLNTFIANQYGQVFDCLDVQNDLFSEYIVPLGNLDERLASEPTLGLRYLRMAIVVDKQLKNEDLDVINKHLSHLTDIHPSLYQAQILKYFAPPLTYACFQALIQEHALTSLFPYLSNDDQSYLDSADSLTLQSFLFDKFSELSKTNINNSFHIHAHILMIPLIRQYDHLKPMSDNISRVICPLIKDDVSWYQWLTLNNSVENKIYLNNHFGKMYSAICNLIKEPLCEYIRNNIPKDDAPGQELEKNKALQQPTLLPYFHSNAVRKTNSLPTTKLCLNTPLDIRAATPKI